MTRLEDHYRLHPFTFFITHMVGMVAFLVVVISGVVMTVHPDVGEAARRAHGVSSALLLLCFVVEVVEVVMVKLASAGKTNPPLGFRFRALVAAKARKDAAVYAAHSIISWVALPITLVITLVSGSRSAEALHAVHPALGAALVLLIVAHAVLTVPARRIRLEVDERAKRR